MNIKDYETVKRIQKIYNSIEEKIERFGDDADIFCENTNYSKSVRTDLERICKEIIYNLSDEFKKAHEEYCYFKGYEMFYHNIQTNLDSIKPFNVWSIVNAETKNMVKYLTHLANNTDIDSENKTDTPLEKLKEGCFYLFKDIDYNGTSVVTRPILVIQTLNENKSLLGLKCTTTEREYDPYSYKLEDWREARLKSPSSVRCDKPIFLSSENVLLTANGKYIKIGHASARDMIAIAKTYDKYCDELKDLSQKFMKNVDKTRVYFIRESSTYSSGNTHNDMKIYSDYDSAKKEYNKMQPKKETVMANGKMQNKITEYETGYVCVDSAGNYDENKDIIVIEKKKYKGTNSQQQKQDSSQRRR